MPAPRPNKQAREHTSRHYATSSPAGAKAEFRRIRDGGNHGTALLGALTVQRFGRRPENCAFPLLERPVETERADPPAA